MKLTNNAVELWCKEVEACKGSGRTLTPEEVELLVSCSLSSSRLDNDKDLLALVESKNAGILSAFWLRVKHCHTYTITLSLAVFISEVILRGNFGRSTMMANYLQWICHTRRFKKLSLDEFCMNVFPFKIPTDEQWSNLWDLQKVDPSERSGGMSSDNILDYPGCLESIRSI